jgi:aminoglycoside 6'-N-acetyltransferase
MPKDSSDHIDRILEQWRRERPDLDTAAMGVLGRLFLARDLADAMLAAPLAERGLQPGWFDVLAALRRSGSPYELNPTDLMHATMLSSGGTTKRLDRLADSGLVERRADPDDRRGTLVRLTRRGKGAIDRAVEAHLVNEERVLRSLAPAERRTLDDLLRKLLEELDRDRPITSIAEPPEPVLLRGRGVVIRPLRVEDVDTVARIQAEPGVARWWGPPDVADLRRQAAGDTEEVAFAILSDGEIVGFIQYAEEDEPDFRHAGIDIFLAEHAQGRGLGTEAIRTLARHLIHERGHHRITIDPTADNARAIRAYEKVGFRPVGILRDYWRSPEGTWRDGLLMDLLASELGPT